MRNSITRNRFLLAARTARRTSAVMCIGASLAAAHGQSFNIDFNRSTAPGNGAPAASFAGAGSAGTWNALTDSTLSMPLVDLNGGATSAIVTRTAGSMTGADSPNTHADFQLLLDDYVLQTSSASTTVTASGLAAGRYRVITYAIRTGSAATISSVSVANSFSANPQTAGGAVPVDSLLPGVTHTSHLVDLSAAGSITMTIGPTAPGTTCAVNGVQLVYSQPTRLYVDAAKPAGGDGLSWASALNDLQSALSSAAVLPTVTEVWVAGGFYRPGGSGAPRSATFTIPSGKRLYGGFAGTETALSQRSIAAHPSVLSGDFAGDDQPEFGNRSENASHVVTLPGNATLDGFTITGGNADNQIEKGGGIRVRNSGNRVDRCIVRDNTAYYGAGIGLEYGFSNLIVRTTITGNRATTAGGFHSASDVTLVACTITANQCLDSGGTGYVNGAARIDDCLVAFNSGGYYHSLMVVGDVSATNCTFVGNYGSAFLLFQSSTLTTTNSIYRSNPLYESAVGGGLVTKFNCLESEPVAFVNALGADGVPGTGDEDFALLPNSPGVDAVSTGLPTDIADLDADGNISEPIPYDVLGNARRSDMAGIGGSGAIADIGAVEAAATVTTWSVGGSEQFWSLASNWSNGTSSPLTTAYLKSFGASSTSIRFSGNGVANRLVVNGQYALFTAADPPRTLTISGLTSTPDTALVVGSMPGTTSVEIGPGTVTTTKDVRIGDALAGFVGKVTFSGPVFPALSCRDLTIEAGHVDLQQPCTIVATGSIRVLSGGTLFVGGELDGDVEVHGVLSPNGAPKISGSLTMAQSPSTPALEVGADGSTGVHDSVRVLGAANLSGAIRLAVAPPLPAIGTSWTLLSTPARSGAFETAFLPGDATKLARLVYNSTAERTATVAVQFESRTNVVNLQPPYGFPVPGTPAAAATGKVHAAANANPDLAVVVPDSGNPTTAPGKLHVLLNLGTTANAWNGWAAVTITKTTQNNPSGVCIADFNADGRSDVAVCNLSSNTMQVFLNNGADDFLAPIAFATGTAPKAVAAGDIDSDGDQDLVVACSGVNQVWLHKNSGAAAFSHASPADEIAVGIDPSAIFVKDIDHTGGPDIGVANRGSNSVAVIFNSGVALLRDTPGDGGGSGRALWQGFLAPQFHVAGSEPSSIEPGQIDNGKDLDLVTGNNASGSVSVLLSNDAGGFSSSSGPIGLSPTSIALVDLDQDGRLDIAAVAENPASPGASVVRVLQTTVDAQGTLQLNQGADIIPDAPPAIVLADDLDGNGIADLITVNPDTVAARGENPLGQRTPTNTIKVRLNLRPCPSDLTGDRVTNTGDLTLLLLRFGQAAPVGSPAAAADLNFDGVVNTADLTQLLLKFGQACPA